MCGIVGIASEMGLSYDERKMFKHLLFIDTLRGIDSTGILTVGADKECKVFKRAVPAYDFLDMRKVVNMLDLGSLPDDGKYYDDYADIRLIIGHNRAASIGAINNQNAHPFTYGDITMVHNGTIYNQTSLGGGNTLSSDSEAICFGMSVSGVKATLEAIDGAAAVVWYNSHDETLNFARNEARPLYYTYNKRDRTIMWASEANMLLFSAVRNGWDLKPRQIKQVPVGTWLSFKTTDYSKAKVTRFVAKVYKKPKFKGGFVKAPDAIDFVVTSAAEFGNKLTIFGHCEDIKYQVVSYDYPGAVKVGDCLTGIPHYLSSVMGEITQVVKKCNPTKSDDPTHGKCSVCGDIVRLEELGHTKGKNLDTAYLICDRCVEDHLGNN